MSTRVHSCRRLRQLFSTFATIVLAIGCSRSGETSKPAPSAAATASLAVASPPLPPVKCEPGSDGRCQQSPTCAANCQPIASAECAKCEKAGDCSEYADSCGLPQLSAEEQGVCSELVSCIQKSNCFDSSASLGHCYCGSLSLEDCIKAPWEGKGAPDGACRDQILKGMPKATTQPSVLAQLTVRQHPAGLAMGRLNCQKFNKNAACAKACGF